MRNLGDFFFFLLLSSSFFSFPFSSAFFSFLPARILRDLSSFPFFFSSSFFLFSSEIIGRKSEKPRKYKGLNEIKRKLQDGKEMFPGIYEVSSGLQFFLLLSHFFTKWGDEKLAGSDWKVGFCVSFFLAFSVFGHEKRDPDFCSESL